MAMTRFSRPVLWGILLEVAALSSPVSVSAADRAPNVVLIVADDLGWSDLSCYGADLHQSPNLDRLASQGMRFTDSYAAAPICSPTRASIMTGKSPARLHMTIWYEAALSGPERNRKLIPPKAATDLPRTEFTIAEVLKAAGYLTAHVGKWHLGDAAHYPETQGFDVNIGGTFWGAPATFFFPYRGLWPGSDEVRYLPHLEWGQPGEYLTDRLTDEALKVIDRAGDRPFFLHLAYHSVHTPIEGKPALVERYRERLSPGLRHQNPGYAAMVHSLDENVGRVLSRLDERGVADSTIVVFTSDNGGYIGRYQGQVVTNNAPLRSGKGSLYEGGIRTPLIVRWPGRVRPGSLCREPVLSTDLYPTLLELTGLHGDPRHNASLDGRSLVPLLNDPAAHLQRDALYFHYPHYYATTSPVGALRAGDWKLLEYFEDQHLELYDLGRDLHERENLAASMPERAAGLHARLRAWRKEVSASMPEVNTEFVPRGAVKKTESQGPPRTGSTARSTGSE